jgi:hypothetical protein
MSEPKAMFIRLEDTEVLIAQTLATLRRLRSRDAGAINTPYAGLKQEDIDLDAMGAELAFCKAVNLYPDLNTSVRPHIYDCLYRGYKVDVKHTLKDNGNLISRYSKKNGDADIYALVRGWIRGSKDRGHTGACKAFTQAG